ncbi:MAG TPA: hypothetical protein VF008_14015, partial [Niastella sp.]
YLDKFPGMQTRKYIYLILGILFIVLGIFSTYLQADDLKRRLTARDVDFAYLLGTQMFSIIGLIFLFSAYQLQQKIKKKKRQSLEEAFDHLGDLL